MNQSLTLNLAYLKLRNVNSILSICKNEETIAKLKSLQTYLLKVIKELES